MNSGSYLMKKKEDFIKIRGYIRVRPRRDRSGLSTSEHIPANNQPNNETAERNKPLCTIFLDYGKAFDSVKTPSVTQAFRRRGVEEACMEVLKGLCAVMD